MSFNQFPDIQSKYEGLYTGIIGYTYHASYYYHCSIVYQNNKKNLVSQGNGKSDITQYSSYVNDRNGLVFQGTFIPVFSLNKT